MSLLRLPYVKVMNYYTIYHVFGKKIGCTSNYPRRCYNQGFVDGQFEVIDLVSKSCGEEFAGDVERAWADWFGYLNYQHYRQNWRNRLTPEVAAKRAKNLAKGVRRWWDTLSAEQKKQIGQRRTVGMMTTPVTPKVLKQMQRRASSQNKRQVKCPTCGQIGGYTNMRRYHFNNCIKG